MSTVLPALHTTGSCSTTPPRAPLHRLLFMQPSTTPRGPVHPEATPLLTVHPTPAMLTVHPRGSINRLQLAAVAKESLDRSGSVTRSLQCNRSGSVRAQRLARVQLEPTPRTHARTCTREKRIARPPTSHRNRQLPEIFLPLASTTVFSVMDGPNNVMQLRLRPAQDEKPIFCHDFLSYK